MELTQPDSDRGGKTDRGEITTNRETAEIATERRWARDRLFICSRV